MGARCCDSGFYSPVVIVSPCCECPTISKLLRCWIVICNCPTIIQRRNRANDTRACTDWSICPAFVRVVQCTVKNKRSATSLLLYKPDAESVCGPRAKDLLLVIASTHERCASFVAVVISKPICLLCSNCFTHRLPTLTRPSPAPNQDQE